MNSSNYHFRVGELRCTLISDGTLTYTTPAQVHFANAQLDQLKEALRRHNIQLDLWNEWISPLPCLLIQTKKNKLLVDAGIGIEDSCPDAGLLLQNLQAEGIEPGDIDFVILTHAHGDHIGWNTNAQGLATFPKARYIIRKEEWDFWTSEETLAQPQYDWMTPLVHKHLFSLFSRFEFLQQDDEIVPGIHTLFAPGHTPGNMAVDITSNDEELLCVGDVITHPIHTERVDWIIESDCHPDQAIRTRIQLLDRAATTHARVFAFHFDFPSIGHVRQQQEAWQWQSISTLG